MTILKTIVELDAKVREFSSPVPQRVHVGPELWSTWVADLMRPSNPPTGLGFPELRTPGGVLVILDSSVKPGQVEFHWGRLKP